MTSNEIRLVTKIKSLNQNEALLENLQKKKDLYKVADTKDVKINDWVVFGQQRDRPWEKSGRIVSVLPGFEINRQIDHAFTIDSPGAKTRDDAITIEDCGEHSTQNAKCKKIGIHVTAVSLVTEPERIKLQIYKDRPSLDFQVTNWSLNAGKTGLAVSAFVHTLSEESSGPFFSQIRVDENYSFDEVNKLEGLLKPVWPAICRKNPSKIFQKMNFKYIADHPKGGKFYLLMEELSSAYIRIVTNYARDVNNAFITKALPSVPEFSDGKVCVPSDLVHKAREYFTGDNKDDMAPLKVAADGRRRLLPQGNKAIHFRQKYEIDVELGSAITDRVIKCTSPLTDFHDFVSQSLLISCMIGGRGSRSEIDLLGISAIRFRSPILRKPIVNGLDNVSAKLHYPETSNVPACLREIPWKSLDDNDVKIVSPREQYKVFLRNISCAGPFFNRTLLQLDNEKFRKFSALYEKGSAPKTKESKEQESNKAEQEVFNLMTATAVEQDATYQQQSEDICFTLQRGTELQVQVSKKDAPDNSAMGLRLLRIGENCHFCFTHVHHPEMAFMSDRKDVRQLINNDTIDALKARNIEEIMTSIKLCDISVGWDGSYEAGGKFEVEEGEEVAKGDLLCIRKEIYKDGEILYVWTCHGVVSEMKNKVVSFSTCTLSQGDSHPGDEGYWVEIMKKPTPQK